MGKISFVSGSLAVAVISSIGACAGKLELEDNGPEIVGHRAELVYKKREWLKRYDEHCNACFDAFKLCQLGAEDDATRDACQVALDACVRGGLVDDNGDGDTPNDPDDGAGDDDTSTDDAGTGSGNDDAPTDDGSAGDDDTSTDDGATSDDDADFDEDIDEARDDNGDDVADEPGVRVREEVVENVRLCLEQGNACLTGGGDFRDCVRALKACVREALDDAFDELCIEQLKLCRVDGSAEELVSSVERLCEGGLGIDD